MRAPLAALLAALAAAPAALGSTGGAGQQRRSDADGNGYPTRAP